MLQENHKCISKHNKNKPYKLAGLIFDMDGTIADTEELHRCAFNAAFAESDLKWQWGREEYSSLLQISGGLERILYYLKKDADTSRLSSQEQCAFAQRVHRLKSEQYRCLLGKSGLALRPGVEYLIRQAMENNIRLGIATSSSLKNVHSLFEQTLGLEMLQEFCVIETGDSVPQKKPSPAVYLQVSKKMQLPAGTLFAIEDTENGNRSALAAGIRTIITTHSLSMNGNYAGASLVLDTLGTADTPFTILAGDAQNRHFVDLELLEQLMVMPAPDLVAVA